MRKHFSSLRSQMMLLTTGTVLAVVILATVFYSSAQRMSEKKAATFVHSMLVQLGDSLDRIGNEMSYLGSALHSNEVLQQYYHAPTAIQRMQYGKSFIDFTSSLLNHSTTVSHIVIVNNDQSILSPTERNIIALDTLDSKYHLFESDNLSSGFLRASIRYLHEHQLFCIRSAGLQYPAGCAVPAKVRHLCHLRPP